METFKNNMAENQEMVAVLKKLESYRSRGYLFHGSKNKIEVLKPRQAHDNDLDATTGNNLNAVYATDDLRIPIIMAIFDKKDKSKKSRASYSCTNNEEMLVDGENITLTPGYIHVLLKDKFQEIEDERTKEIVAFQNVSPIEIIRITTEILDLIPGITYDLK
jgi:hypothetical protein